MPSSYSLAINDNSISPRSGAPESSTTSFPIDTLTPANVADALTLAGNLKTAIAGICIGQLAHDEVVYERSIISNAPAASKLAQRENKWLCRYIDAVTSKKYSLSIGTADLTKVGANSEFVDLSTGPGAAFKTAFEAFVHSPDVPGNGVTLVSVQFVGRNT